jgi:hypothetical protein
VENEPGVYKMSFDDYLADPCPEPSLTRSTIKELLFRTPLHAFYGHPRLNPNYQKEEKVQFDIGTAAHSIFLQGIDVVMTVDADDWKKKANQELRDEIRALGKIPLLTHQHEEVIKIVNAAHLQLWQFELEPGKPSHLQIGEGDSELTYVWKEGDTWCRIRPDWISKARTLMMDFKTTATSADPENYNRNLIVGTGLDIQDSFYRRGVTAIEKTVQPDMIFMVQEIYEPYLCTFIRLDMMYADMGEQKVKRGIQVWRECLKTGVWPGYPKSICTVEPMPWAVASWELRRQFQYGEKEIR